MGGGGGRKGVIGKVDLACCGSYIKLSIPDRREAVRELAAEGLSNVAVGQILGVTEGTIRNDLGLQNCEPDRRCFRGVGHARRQGQRLRIFADNVLTKSACSKDYRKIILTKAAKLSPSYSAAKRLTLSGRACGDNPVRYREEDNKLGRWLSKIRWYIGEAIKTVIAVVFVAGLWSLVLAAFSDKHYIPNIAALIAFGFLARIIYAGWGDIIRAFFTRSPKPD